MLEDNHSLVNEIDPLKDLNNIESRQVKGFSLTGIKYLTYLGNNELNIKELPNNIEYIMEYTNVSRILRVLGFNEKTLELSLDKLLSRHEVIYDFDNKDIYLRDDHKVKSPVLAYMSNAVREYNQVFGGVISDSEIDVDTLRLLTNKN